MELIRAIPPAAAEPERNAGGIAQKGPCAAFRPAQAIDSAARARRGCVVSIVLSRNPALATNIDSAACQRRSPVRSECLPTSTIVTAATR